MSVPLAQLSCEECSRRKTKCNKTIPCSACEKAGIKCTAVQRQRLPRGRSGKQKTRTAQQVLRDRVERLESLLSGLQQPQPQSRDLHENRHGTQEPLETPLSRTTPVESFVAPDFWADLSGAVAGLKQVLEHPDNFEEEGEAVHEDELNHTDLILDDSVSSSDAHRLLFEKKHSAGTGFDLSTALKDYLLDMYQGRVDSIFKPLHWPSVLSTIRQRSRRDVTDTADAHALECTLYFAGACTLFDHELDGRRSMVERLRQDCEKALVHAGLLTTTSFTLLQAFVVYLVGLRACLANAQQWTLTAIAIRLASAQGIPSNLTDGDVSLDLEVRRRLWQCIGVLDLQSAFDRGSQPMIEFHDLQSLPLDINDDELSLQSKLPTDVATQSRWTDMSLNVIIYRAGICRRHIIAIGNSSASSPGDHTNARGEQLATLANFERRVQQLSAVCSSPPSNIQKFAMAVAQESLVAMRLLLHRPLHRRSSVPVDNMLPGEQIDILQTATEVLERSQMKRTQFEFAQWAWFQWVKWYALAVVLAELCAAPQGPQADRAWKAAQLSFDDYAKDVADSRNGLLWKPIQRLMRRAEQARTPDPVSLKAMTTEQLSKGHEDVNMNDSRTVPDYENWPVDHVTGLENVSLAKDYNDVPFEQFQTVDDSWLQWDLLLNDFEDPNLSDA